MLDRRITTDRSLCGLTAPQSCTFADSFESPGRARQFVFDALCREHGPLALVAAQLVASELVTRAVLQAGAPVLLTVTCRLDEIRVDVAELQVTELGPVHAYEVLRSELLSKISRRNGTIDTGAGRLHWCEVPTGYLPVHADTF